MQIRLVRFLKVVFFLACLTPLHAQTFNCLTSIDSIVSGSEAVFIGHATVVHSTSNDIYGHQWTNTEFVPDEVLRGKANVPFSANVAIRDNRLSGLPTPTPSAWLNNRHRILVIVEDHGQETRWPTLATTVDLDLPALSAWRADFTRIQTSSALLETVRAEIDRLKNSPHSVPSVCIDKPKGDYQGTLLSDMMTRGLIVPADDRMEARALGTIDGSIQTFYGEDSQYIALQDLGTRPSPQIISVLMKILNGPNHRLRWGAYEALTQMGKKVAPPN